VPRSLFGARRRRIRREIVDTAVRFIVEGFANSGSPGDAPVLVLGSGTAVADRLAEEGLRVASLPLSGASAVTHLVDPDPAEPGQLASAWVLDGVLESTDDPSELLAAAYSGLAPGGLLVGAVYAGRGRDRGGPRAASRAGPPGRTLLGGQLLQSLVFREGFVAPSYRRFGDGSRLVTAQRGDLAPPRSRDLRLSVIVPAYDEAKTFPKVMEKLLAKEIAGVEIAVVVVESKSNDGTRELALGFADHPRVSLVLEERARGKGHAVRAGLATAKGDLVMIQDADLEYEIDDYDALLAPLRSFETGFVLGVRARTLGATWGVRHFASAGLASRFMNVGNWIFRALFNVVYQQRLRDPFTMAKVFRRDCVNGMRLECDRFDFDWELLAKLVRAGYAPVEVPISYQSRSFSEGKKIRVIGDPFTWVRACFKYRFTPPYGR